MNQLVTETNDSDIITYTYDDNGNLIKEQGERTKDYTYDSENHLVSAMVQQGENVTLEEYTYDYAGNRTSKIVNGSNVTKYINDISSSLTYVLGETDKDGKLKKSFTRGHELISAESKILSAASATDIHYFLYDGHGSTSILTDKDGNVTDRYSYDGDGILLEKEGDTENDFLYTGEQYNYTTELYYLRARYMDPSTGTFISMDSYAGTLNDPVSLHKYLYANANPIMNTDPSGYTSLADIAGGLAISAILAVVMASAIMIYKNKLETTPIIGDMYVVRKELKDLIEIVKVPEKVSILILVFPIVIMFRQFIEIIYKTTVDILILVFPAHENSQQVFITIDDRNVDTKTTRKQAFNEAKDRAGIPRSQQPIRQWTVGDDISKKGYDLSNYKYDDNPGSHGRYYEYETDSGKIVIVEHTNDGTSHFHAGQPKRDADPYTYDFKVDRYQNINVPGKDKHIYYDD